MRKIAGVLIGLAIVYLCCAMLAWDFNPEQWGWFLRLWALGWGVVWGLGGLMLGMTLDDEAVIRRNMRKKREPASLPFVG